MATIDVGDLARAFAASDGDGVPAYERIKRVVAEQIRAGRWDEGAQLPSENQLVALLGVSRMTINRALRELSSDGIIVRSMGVGTFVASAKATTPLFEVRNIADDVQRRGHHHRTRVVLLEAEHHPERPFASQSTSDRVFHSIVVHYEDDTPIQVEDRLVNPALVPSYLEQDFTAGTPNDYLTRIAPLARGEHIVEAVLPTTEEAGLLGLEPSEPCLLIRRRTWSADGLVSIARLIQPGSRSRLEGAFVTSTPPR
jgi:GntR family histidine utilization transcriptional repressor